MSSYLLGLRQRVKVQGICSSYRDINVGVPQGSLLEHLLFNIFINDLNFFVPNMSLRLYADNTTGYFSDTSPTVLQFIMNSELRLLSSWFDRNCLQIDNDKTQSLPIGPCSYEYDLALNGNNLETQGSIKILGVTLDRMLTFKEHISLQLKKAYTKSSALRRINRLVPAAVMIRV